MKKFNVLIALGLLGLPALSQAQDVPAKVETRDKAFYKEQLQLLKEMIVFFNDSSNMPVMTNDNVTATILLNIETKTAPKAGQGGTRRQRPGSTGGAEQYAGRMLAIALDVYAHKHPGDYGKLKEQLLKGIPMPPATERTMHQFPEKYRDDLKPYITPPGSEGVNPRARQAGGGRRPQLPQPLPRTTWEPTWKLLGQVLIAVHDAQKQPLPR